MAKQNKPYDKSSVSFIYYGSPDRKEGKIIYDKTGVPYLHTNDVRSNLSSTTKRYKYKVLLGDGSYSFLANASLNGITNMRFSRE